MVCLHHGVLLSLKIICHHVTYATTWTKLEDVVLNEISQLREDKYCMILLMILIA